MADHRRRPRGRPSSGRSGALRREKGAARVRAFRLRRSLKRAVFMVELDEFKAIDALIIAGHLPDREPDETDEAVARATYDKAEVNHALSLVLGRWIAERRSA
jgi:hypothetical protein